MNVTIEQAVECTTWKTCRVCKEEKKTVFFSKRGKGFKTICKECDAKAYLTTKAKIVPTIEAHKASLFNRIIAWIKS